MASDRRPVAVRRCTINSYRGPLTILIEAAWRMSAKTQQADMTIKSIKSFKVVVVFMSHDGGYGTGRQGCHGPQSLVKYVACIETILTCDGL